MFSIVTVFQTVHFLLLTIQFMTRDAKDVTVKVVLYIVVLIGQIALQTVSRKSMVWFMRLLPVLYVL